MRSQVAILACMDARLHPTAVLGLNIGASLLRGSCRPLRCLAADALGDGISIAPPLLHAKNRGCTCHQERGGAR